MLFILLQVLRPLVENNRFMEWPMQFERDSEAWRDFFNMLNGEMASIRAGRRAGSDDPARLTEQDDDGPF